VSSNGEGLFGLFMGAVGATIFWGITLGGCDAKWKRDAIERGYAEYNSVNGKWQWKEPINAKGRSRY
jgi:hypothetical protein